MSTYYPQPVGYPAPQYAPPAYRLYDVAAISIAAFFGGPLAGTVLMASNYRKLGQGNNGVLALILGAAASVGLVYMALKTTANPAIASVVLLVCTVLAAKQLQGEAIKTHVAWGGQLYSKGRAFGVAIATTLVLGGAFVGYLVYTGQWQSFGARYGVGQSTVTIGTKDQVIYSGTATQADATALGNALKAAGFFQDHGVTVALSKGTSGTTIGFDVQDGAWNQAGTLETFEEIARGVASSVGGLPLQVQLLSTTQTLEKSGTVGEVDFTGGDAVIYESSATQADAQALGNQFKTIGFFEGKGANVFLTKDNGTTIAFVVSDGTWNDATMVSDFETIVRGVASTVGGLPIDLRLDNTSLVVEKDETIQ